MIKTFKVPEFKQLTPEQLEESKKRLQEMNDRFLKRDWSADGGGVVRDS